MSLVHVKNKGKSKVGLCQGGLGFCPRGFGLCPFGVLFGWGLSAWVFVRLEVCPGGFLFGWGFVRVGFCPRGVLFGWVFVLLSIMTYALTELTCFL